MIATFIIACVVGAANIFCFFSPALSFTPEYSGRQSQFDICQFSMFNYIFGAKGVINDRFYYDIKGVGGMTFLFILQLFVIFLAIIGLGLLLAYKRYRITEVFFGVVPVVGIILCALSALVAYSTPMILKVDTYQFTWGFGPIAYCILQIFVIILFAAVLHGYHTDKIYAETNRATNKQKIPNSRPHRTSREIRAEQMANTNKDDKVDLILKYKRMYDNSEISEEEYNKKKDELL